ncbi:MAG: hypothetical protein AAGI07_05440 [Bacteroidota bacterium]
MEKSKYWAVLPLIVLLFIGFSCSFDQLEAVGDEMATSGLQVREVKAYFVDEYAIVKNKKTLGFITFDKEGLVDELEQKAHPVFLGESFLDNIDYERRIKEDYSSNIIGYFPDFFKMILSKKLGLSVESLPLDFYTSKVQWLFSEDPKIKTSFLEVIFYNKYFNSLMEFEEKMFTKERSYTMQQIMENGDNKTSFIAEKVNEYGISKVERYQNININALPTHWEKKFEYIPNEDWESGIKNREYYTRKLYILDQKTCDINYSQANLLSNISYYSKYGFDNQQGYGIDETEEKLNIDFFYNEKEQIEEIALFSEKLLLRKYRFHYNEAGYCTKKELINREEKVEFSVLFEYDFYPDVS